MSLLKNDRFWLLGGALVSVVLAALAWFVVVGPELSHASSLDSQTTDAQVQNIALQSKLHKLQQANADLPALTGTLLQARTALPVDLGIAAYTQQLGAIAAASHVTVTGLNASSPVPGVAKQGQPSAISGPVAGQLFALPLTVIVKGPVTADLVFLHAVQQAPRAALVTSSQLTSDSSKTSKSTQLTVQLQVFVAPQTPGATAALEQQLTAGSK